MLSVPHTSYAKDTVLLNFNENKINSQTVYPVISMKVKGQSLTILVDSGASSSHITRKAANKVGVIEKIRRHPLLIYGFGNSRSKPVTKFASLTLVGARNVKISIDFNIIESEIISKLPGVTSQIFEEFPHLLQHRRQLSTRIPRSDTEVDAIIGVKDKPKLALKHDSINDMYSGCSRNPCVMRNADFTISSVIQVQPTIFGDIVEGGMNTSIEEYLPFYKKKESGVDKVNDDNPSRVNKTNDNVNESILAIKDVPLDVLLNKVFETDIGEKDIKDKSQMQQKALERFNQTHTLIPQDDGNFRFKIKVTRLPDDLYPENVDGVKITNQALSRYYALENRLHAQRNGVLKKGVHERIQALIDDGIIKEVGNWDDHKEKFLKPQAKENENILLPWQCVIDSSKTMEHSRIRLCLDATEANRLIYKIDAEMPSILEMLVLWRLNRFWCFLDLKSMFWSILTDEADCKLQQCIFRFSKEEKIKLYLFVRCVMGMCDSPGLARLVLLKLAETLKDEFPMAKETIKNRHIWMTSKLLATMKKPWQKKPLI